jgi:hypothetical protein
MIHHRLQANPHFQRSRPENMPRRCITLAGYYSLRPELRFARLLSTNPAEEHQ